MHDWTELQFKDFVTLQRGFDLPKSRMMDGVVPVLGSKSVIGFHNEAKVEAPGVVTGRSGTLGLVQYSEQSFWPHNTALWVKDFKENSPRFVYYKLQTLNLERFNGGVSVPTLNRNVLDTLPVKIPKRTLQDRIASILSNYDDLIENNQRRIQLLEQSAQLLYKEWFVHLRFPGHEHVTMTDGVPEEWKKKVLGDIVEVTKGKNITKNTATDGSVPVVAGGLFPAYYHDTANVMGPVITVSASGANAGYVNLYHEDIWASDCSYINGTATEYLYYFYLLLKSKQKEIFGFQKGAAQPHVYPKDLQRLPLLVPNDSILRIFEEFVLYNFRQMSVLLEQNKLLMQARDLLLPRLMNGEVGV